MILQHLSINQIKRKPMGDLQSKPMQNQQLRHLQQQYEPFSKGKLIPGEPTYLKLNSIFQKNEYSDKINNRFKKVERYQIFKRYTESSLQEDRNIYDYRRTNLPCIVQIVYCCIEKEDCECSNNAYRTVLFTEHVETRLAHYKTTKKVQNNQQQSIQYYHPFTQDEGIYVLINALHAYQLLSQQFFVNYPSPFSVGINYKAQIKVWINDNWSINDQNHRKLSENIIIQEIINIIEERMESNFNQILNVTANYMNFTFTSIQDILSKYTINYQKGKKSLEDRLNSRTYIKDGDKSNIFTQKYPLGKHRPNSIHTVSNTSNNIPINSIAMQEATKSTQQSRQLNEKRHLSQQNCKKTNQVLITNSARNYSITPRTSIEDSPKKVVKFTYQQTQSQRQSPKISNFPRNSSPISSISSFNQTLKLVSPPAPIYSYAIAGNQNRMPAFDTNPKQHIGNNRPLMMPSNVSADFLNKATITSLIDKKLNIQTQSSNKNSGDGKTVMSHTAYKRQTPAPVKTEYNSFEQNPMYLDSKAHNIIINPFQITSKQEKKVQFECSQQKMQKKSSKQLKKTSVQNASLSEITQQFKNLLKSDRKIEERQELFYQYEQQDASADKGLKDRIKTVQQTHDNNPYVHSFCEIKEEDEDVSYSIDQLI